MAGKSTTNGNGRVLMWALGLIAPVMLGIALAALYASSTVGSKVDLNCSEITHLREDQQDIEDALKWQRTALYRIAEKVGAQLPDEK